MPDPIVTVRRYYTLDEAHIARGFLESEGIHSFLEDQHLVRMDIWSAWTGYIQTQSAGFDCKLRQTTLSEHPPFSQRALLPWNRWRWVPGIALTAKGWECRASFAAGEPRSFSGCWPDFPSGCHAARGGPRSAGGSRCS